MVTFHDPPPPGRNRGHGIYHEDVEELIARPGQWGMLERSYRDLEAANSAGRYIQRHYTSKGTWEVACRSQPDGTARVWLRFAPRNQR